ncbi:hypothetical protein D3C80_957950 [compost metagenome]
MGAQLADRALYVGIDDVGDEQLGAGRVQVAGEAEADLADALDRYLQTPEVVAAEAVAHRGLQADEHPVGGGRRRIAVEAFARLGAGHVAGAPGHQLHLGHPGAGVGGADVAPAEAVDQRAHRLEQRRALAAVRVADDHRLAAAQWQVGQRRLVGHAARQAQHVAQRFLVAGVGPHAAAAEGRTQGGVVDGDDGLEAAGLVVAEDDLLVLVELAVGKHGHRGTSGFLLLGFAPLPCGGEGLGRGKGQTAGSHSCTTGIARALRRSRSAAACARTLASARSLTWP